MKRSLRLTTFVFFSICAIALAQDPTLGNQILISVDAMSNSANETSASCTLDGSEFVGGFNDWRPDGTIKAGFSVTSNGGASWAHILVRPPAANQSTVEGDPMACYDPRTNTLWAGAMSFAANGGIYIAKKNSGSNSFQPSIMARTNGSVDKGWMAAGPVPGNPSSTRVYITYNQGVIRSDDLGATWTSPISLGSGLGFLPRVGPNGELYVTYWNTSTLVQFKRSLDGGNTFTTVTAATRMDTWSTQTNNGRVPGDYRIPPIHTMAVNPINGKIVIVYFDNTNTINGNRNLDLYMVTSSNQGTNWTTPVRLPFRPLTTVGDMFFPWLEYSPEGRLHLLSFNTVYTNQNDGGSHGWLDQDYAYSDDDGANWSRFRLTPNSFDSFNDGRGQAATFMGDYSGIALGKRHAIPAYVDTHGGHSSIYTNIIFNPILVPSAFSFFRGAQSSGSLSSLFLHDGNVMIAKPGPVIAQNEPPLQLAIDANAFDPVPTYLKVHLWTSANTTGLEQLVLVKNRISGNWDQLDARPAPTSETNTVVDVANPSNYINPGTGLVQARIAFRQVGPVAIFPWSVSFNQAVFLAGPP